MFWLLSFSDGSHDLIDISEKSGIQFEVLHDVALKLQESKLLKAVT
jgi:aminopeptidase-like protein